MAKPNKINSNEVGAYFAEEESLKVLSGSPVWYELEPNGFSKWGAETSTVARTPLNASRQRKKGTVVDITASGEFNTDVTQNNLTRLLQGFYFADAHEKPNTQPLNGTQVAITAVASGANTFAAASGLGGFKVGHLTKASGFGNSANNGLTKITAVAAGLLTTSKALTAEAAPPATAKIEAVGFEFGAGDLTLTASASSIVLACTAGDFTTLALNVGEWIMIGGDSAGLCFANNTPGYARIKSIAAKSLVLSETTFAATTDTGAAKTVQIFFGTVIRNESTSALIKRRSYQLERQLGNDGDGIQSEYLLGSIPDVLKLAIPKKKKLSADLSFVSMDAEYRDGTVSPKAGTRVAALGESAYNSSSDIYRFQMEIVDPVTLNPSPLFGYVSEATIEIKNGISPDTAIATVGAFDASAGDFEVSGTATAYFSTLAAVQAIRNNADVCLNIIGTKNNAGFVHDIPLITLSGGQAEVKKDSPVTLQIKQEAAACAANYTMLSTFFSYLPTVGTAD